ASGRPGNAALNARLAAQNMGTLGAGLAGQQAIAGIQERTAAQQQLANVLGTTRSQDQGMAQFNVGAQLQNQQQGDTAYQQALAQQLQAAQLQQQGGQAYSTNLAMQQLSQQQLAQQAALAQLNAATTLQAAGQSNPMLNAFMQGGSNLAAYWATRGGSG